jgi:class 3 adenylate cyclase/tetratricopeptide (TPR) repeat protein
MDITKDSSHPPTPLIRCKSCGFENPPQNRFCGGCGVRLPVVDEAPSLPAEESRASAAAVEGKESMGQNRSVTVLFIDICDFTPLSERFDREDVYSLVQEFIQRMSRCVSKYDGAVDKMTGDGLMALFGAPVAYENNAERAVRAALDMLAAVNEFSAQLQAEKGIPLQVRIGLNTGAVVVGGISAPSITNYTAIGNTVNLASRLCSAGEPGTITASKTVYRQTRHLFNFSSEGMLTLKGIANPVQAYRVIDARPRSRVTRSLTGMTSPMVGRDGELVVMLRAAQDLVHNRRGQFVMITGEAGVGKSRLLQAFKDEMSEISVRLLEGNGESFQHGASYALLGEMIRGFVDTEAGAHGDQKSRLEQVTTAALGDRAQEILPYLHYITLADSGAEIRDRFEFLDSSQLRIQGFLAVRAWLLALARSVPLVIILDDLQWADEASLEFMRFLNETLSDAPIFIVGSSRPYEPTDPLDAVVKMAEQRLEKRFALLTLNVLSAGQSEQLLKNLLATNEIPAELKTLIAERSGGLPLYLEEFLKTLLERGILSRNGPALLLTADLEQLTTQVPDSIEGLILARFDRLQDDEKRALQLMSVMGSSFHTAVLMKVIPALDPHTMANLLASLIGRAFLSPKPASTADAIISFRNSVTKDVIYSTLLRSERMEMHGAVGQAIEQLCAGDVDPRVEELAHHFYLGSNPEKAFHYLCLAGEKLARDDANDRARQNYLQALELMPHVEHDPRQELQILRGLGDVEVFLGDYQSARVHYQSALVPASAQSTPEQYVALTRLIGSTYEREGAYDQAVSYLEKARAEIDRRGNVSPIELGRMLSDGGWIAFRRGQLEQADFLLNEALNLVKESGQSDLIASIYNRLGGVAYQQDHLEQASWYTRQSLLLRVEIGDSVAVARTYSNLGLLEWKAGAWNSALDDFKHSLELHANIGDVEGSINLAGNLGLLLLDRGDLEDAERQLLDALREAEQIDHPYHIGAICLHLGRLYIAMRRWGDALRYGQRSAETLRMIGSNDNLVDALTNIGSALLGMGEIDKAYDQAREAINLTRTLRTGRLPGKSDDRARVLRLLADISTVKRDYLPAERFLKESAAVFEALGDQLEIARCDLRFATLAALQGDPATAAPPISKAVRVFRSLGAKHDLQLAISTARQMKIPITD